MTAGSGGGGTSLEEGRCPSEGAVISTLARRRDPKARLRARRALELARGRSRSRPPEGAAGAGAAEPEEGGGEPAEKGQPRRHGRQRQPRSSAPRASPVPAPR